MSDLSELKLLRRRIREVTKRIIMLSGERIELARKVGAIKRRLGIDVEDPEVEEELKKDIVGLCEEKGINVELGLSLLHLLVKEAKKAQKERQAHV